MELPVITAVIAADKIDKNGHAPILIRVIYKRVRYKKYTGFKVDPTLFSPDALIDSKVSNYAYKNNILRQRMADMERAFIKHLETAELSKDSIRIIVQGDVTTGMTVKKLCEAVKRHYDKDISGGTLRNWDVSVGKLEDFLPNLKTSQITPQILKRFEAHMKDKLLNSDNTIWSTMKNLRSIFNKAMDKPLNLISYNPFEDNKTKAYKQPARTFTQQSDIDVIEQYADNKINNTTLRHVAAWYIMAAYSGLRFGDLERWDESVMVQGDRVYFEDKKTGTPHFIPLYPKLTKAIERVRDFPKIMTNAKCNFYLKDLGSYLGVGKLNMHKARHSFSVNFLANKGSMEVLQKLLGHKKISTTQIYGQIIDSRIEDEVKKAFGGE